MENDMERTRQTQIALSGKNGRGSPVKGRDFTTAFTLAQTPDEAFKAINNVRGWWSENIEGATDVLNGEFIFHNEPVHYSRIKVVELVPGKRVAWRIIENSMSFVDDKSEWIGNEV